MGKISRSPLWSFLCISLIIPYISNKEYKQKPSVELLVYFLTDGIAKLTVTSSFVIKLFGLQS